MNADRLDEIDVMLAIASDLLALPVSYERQTGVGLILNAARQRLAAIHDGEAELIVAQHEIERLRPHNNNVLAAKAAAATKATPLPPTEAERLIKRLREQLGVAQAEISHLRGWHKTTGIPERGVMSFSEHGTIMKVLHPDHQPSEADRAEACRVFTAWAESYKPARSRSR